MIQCDPNNLQDSKILMLYEKASREGGGKEEEKKKREKVSSCLKT